MSNVGAQLIEIRENRQEIEEIAKMTQEILDSERSIAISRHDAIPTIVYEYIASMYKYLATHKSTSDDVQIKFADLFTAGVSYRDAEDDGEKDGNFTPYMNPGYTLKMIIKGDDITEED